MSLQDVSGFGSTITLTADSTYPIGVQISDFAADTDPFDTESIEIAGQQMGLNGDLIVWAMAKAIPFKISVIPGSPSDLALQILADNNRVGPNKTSSADVIDLAVVLPGGETTVYGTGRLLTAPFGRSVTSGGMQKTRTYGFVFASKVGA